MSLLISVVEGGRSYKEVASDLGVARSTVERRIKGLLRRLQQAGALGSIRVDWLDSLVAIRRERETIMAAARAHDVGAPPPPCRVVLDADEVAAGASRLRSCCRSANRDIALIYTLLCTGLKTMELALLEAAESRARQRDERAKALSEQLDDIAAKEGAAIRAAKRVEDELATWSLLAKCLSNDGVIALDIDDAGPTFSALANELLLACYGPRFTLQVITQSTNGKGELREDFDIIVHDGLRDESKSLKLVSGGERVWINECLTRAIALYLSGNTGRRIGTLFSDEADGPLDPEHKRMFMAMKREVLRLGGYACEFFVSQTSELTGMADRIIDLEGMAMQVSGEVA